MKFSTRSTYGLRAVIELAKNWGGESVSLSKISNKERISLGYLERIFSILKKKKIVVAEKGSGGGYKLATDPQKLNIFDIIEALEGRAGPFYCMSGTKKMNKVYCGKSCACGVTFVLDKIQKSVGSALKQIKLSDLLK